MGIYADIQQLEPGELVDLWQIDMTAIGGDVRRLHGYTQLAPIVWQGEEYHPWPLQASGFELTGDGRPAAPSITVANVDGSMGALCRLLDDLIGARVLRLRTLGKYLDAVNFPEGNPSADPDEQLRPEVWYVEQRSRETRDAIEFTLASPLNLNGAILPGRQIMANMCGWLKTGGYRGPYCGYTGTVYFNASDQPVADPSMDVCGGRVSSCKCRFGEFAELPFGGMPAADTIRGY